MEPSLTGVPASVDDRPASAPLLSAFALALALADEGVVLAAPRLPETTIAADALLYARTGVAVVVLALPLLALARAPRRPSAGDVTALLVLVAERTAVSAVHRPWSPGRLDSSREALTAAASTVLGGVPWGGLGAWVLAAGLAFGAYAATRANFSRAISAICGALTLLFASGATLVYASGAGEAWFEPSSARTAAPCPAPQLVPETPKEMENGSENRDPK
jgi:hypothetical protein